VQISAAGYHDDWTAQFTELATSGFGPSRLVQRLTTSVAIGEEQTWL
jgi:hypothetical protein